MANFDATITSIISGIAQKDGVPADLALATAYVESGLNPASMGDGGNSVGLYQLNSAGEGAGMTVAQRQDPTANAGIALAQLAKTFQAMPGADPGAVAAAAQRPADPAGYAATVDAALSLFGGTSQAVTASPAGLPSVSAAAGVFTGLGHGIVNGIVALGTKIGHLIQTQLIALAVAATVLYVWTESGT
jgi:soluble lytic murein transglycosylase-like protein